MSDDTGALTVRHNKGASRFEIEADGKVALLDYMWTGRNITYTHTEVPPELEGQGIGGKLARYALEFARDNDLKVIPVCPFVTGYLRRHPEYRPLVFGYKGPA
jgi:predicted GNAT family acetyltransferase